MTQFKVEVIADSSGKWTGNAMVYDTFEEAEEAALGLAYRWFAVRQARVVGFSEELGVESETEVFG
ncbi:MAG: hypothetical protein PVI97_00325 [Candidatus Thiodiazotropha sp.]|jgi:hypothetical protein